MGRRCDRGKSLCLFLSFVRLWVVCLEFDQLFYMMLASSTSYSQCDRNDCDDWCFKHCGEVNRCSVFVISRLSSLNTL